MSSGIVWVGMRWIMIALNIIHPASFPVVFADLRSDVTCQACQENSPRNSHSANWPGYQDVIHQSKVTLVHPNDPRNRGTKSLHPFSFQFFLEWKIEWVELTPLSPNGDQHQISLNNILVLSREMVARSPKRKCFDLLLNSLNLSLGKCMNISVENL